MELITIERIRGWDALEGEFDEDGMQELLGGNEEMTVLEILRGNIPDQYKAWLITRHGCIPENILKRWIDLVAYRILSESSCKVSAMRARKWLSGEYGSDYSYSARALSITAFFYCGSGPDVELRAAEFRDAEFRQQVQDMIELLEESEVH